MISTSARSQCCNQALALRLRGRGTFAKRDSSSFGREAAESAREFRELADREELLGDAIRHDDAVHLAERGPSAFVIDRIECQP